ncbi:valine--tRNA ligase [Jannaschia aquimarina]|uniref:Valine--tRNA ligase n=1 Tax=Jannaschia aquimarina TaxID=935700 RepID=A0A0D1EFF9_9RHOB|nr:valine--tRNA ligase [Jannaschia aquimarina]KIT15626.1 Valine--tRNA ligase [Jannaschia aquimarina]SNT02872.1 valyl-tRNA synthetase [Jannaschia aquimarina]
MIAETSMDKTFDAAEAEKRITEMWLENKCFAAGANAKPGAETFSILIPPPNVTGSLHMGHAFNNTLQDILVRWHRMRGHDTLWQPGTDHAGIATQMVVERELAKTNRRRTDMSREDFLELVWQQKHASRGTIIGQLQRLGASCDWDREAFTMGGAPGDPDQSIGGGQNFHDAVIKVFVEMYEKGLIYRGKRLVNWDPKFETAISDLEVENIETPGHMWHFKYPLAGGATYEYVERDEDGNELFRETRDYISIATTRPETMLGDGAVAVHPSDERYAPIVGKLCEIPVGPKEHRRLIPIITDEYPDPDFGSGAVKITGAHDFNDYGVAQRGGIPCYRLMDTKAAMRADGAPYAEAAAIAMEVAQGKRTLTEAETDAINLVPDHLRGLDRFDARAKVVEEITAEGLAVMVPATDPRLGKGAASAGKDATGEAPLAPEEGGEPRTEEDQLVPLVGPKAIMQPHGDRSKVVIEPMLTDQWFVDTDKIVGPAIEAVENGTTRILPEADKKVYFHWLRNIEPWCISRRLWWGHRIPVWYGPKFDAEQMPSPADYEFFCASEPHIALQEAQRFYEKAFPGLHIEVFERQWDEAQEEEQDDLDGYNEMAERHGLEKVYAKSVIGSNHGFSVKYYRVEDRPARRISIERDPDVLDTWFSSGLWPLGTLGWPEDTEEVRKYFPTSTLITGFDILFFWVARMMMMQTAVLPKDAPLAEKVPFRDVYVHALVRDAKGQKMSKSLGNVLDPLDLIDVYGADAVRFTLASMAAMGRDLKLSEDRIKGYRNFGTKLWNAVRFAQMNDATFGGPRPDPRATVNRWIVGETARVREDVDAALAAYRFDEAAQTLYRFVWNVVCDWYVEFAKPLMDGEAAEETRATMGWVLDRCMVLLHPFMPFITEELWALTAKRDTPLVHGDWPDGLTPEIVDEQAEAEMRWVIAFIEAIRSARAQMNVPAGQTIPVLRLDDEAGKAAYASNSALIQRLARIEGVADAGEAPKGSAAVTVGTARYALPLEGLIEPAAEEARLTKQLGKLEKEIKGLAGRANNPKFAASAPPEVVEETKANLAAREAEAQAVRDALRTVRELT